MSKSQIVNAGTGMQPLHSLKFEVYSQRYDVTDKASKGQFSRYLLEVCCPLKIDMHLKTTAMRALHFNPCIRVVEA